MADRVLVTMKMTDDIIVDVYEDSTPKKYCIVHKKDGDVKSKLYKVANKNDGIVLEAMSDIAIKEGKSKSYYKILQNPYTDTRGRHYGQTPYYLDDGSSIKIQWFKDDANVYSYKDDGLAKTVDYKSVIIMPGGDYYKSFNISYNKAQGFSKIDPNDKNINGTTYSNAVKDSDIINELIEKLKISTKNSNNISSYKVALCNPSDKAPNKNTITYRLPFYDDSALTNKIDDYSGGDDNLVSSDNEIYDMVVDNQTTIHAKADKTLDAFSIIFEQSTVNDPTLAVSDEYVENASEAESEVYNTANNSKSFTTEVVDPDTFVSLSPAMSATTVTAFLNKASEKASANPTKANNMLKAMSCVRQSKGRCPLGTWTIAINYYNLNHSLRLVGMVDKAGGNANMASYYNRYVNELRYTKVVDGTFDKKGIINAINSRAWRMGDVAVYWALDGGGDSSRIYGHTQIYNGCVNGYSFSSDDLPNYGAAFVYGNRNHNVWRLLIFTPPLL